MCDLQIDAKLNQISRLEARVRSAILAIMLVQAYYQLSSNLVADYWPWLLTGKNFLTMPISDICIVCILARYDMRRFLLGASIR